MASVAVISTGGKQYLVKEGDTVRIEKLEAKEGDKVSFDVLFLAGDATKIGKPTVSGAKVDATVKKLGRADKVTIIKFHPKTRYKRKAGHRQHFTEIMIDSIKA